MALATRCLDCGTRTRGSRCRGCEARRDAARGTTTERGYGAAHQRRARSALALQPWCSRCGSTRGLTADHITPLSRAGTRSGGSGPSAAGATAAEAPTTHDWPSYDQNVTAHRDERDVFVAAAREYCELYEGAQELGAERFLLGLASALPRLHAAGVDLKYPDDELPADDVDVGLTTEEMQSFAFPVGDVLREIDWSRLHGELRESVGVGPIDVFLYDDLHGIYRDLWEGFRLLDAGRPEAEAVFHWRLSFWSHWGYHCVDALRVIHYYVALYLAG